MNIEMLREQFEKVYAVDDSSVRWCPDAQTYLPMPGTNTHEYVFNTRGAASVSLCFRLFCAGRKVEIILPLSEAYDEAGVLYPTATIQEILAQHGITLKLGE